MYLEITLDKTEACLGLLDMEVLTRVFSTAVAEAATSTVFDQMPALTSEAARKEMFADSPWRGEYPPTDFEASAWCTIRWMLRTFTIGPKRGVSVADSLRDPVLKSPRISLPVEGGEQTWQTDGT